MAGLRKQLLCYVSINKVRLAGTNLKPAIANRK